MGPLKVYTVRNFHTVYTAKLLYPQASMGPLKVYTARNYCTHRPPWDHSKSIQRATTVPTGLHGTTQSLYSEKLLYPQASMGPLKVYTARNYCTHRPPWDHSKSIQRETTVPIGLHGTTQSLYSEKLLYPQASMGPLKVYTARNYCTHRSPWDHSKSIQRETTVPTGLHGTTQSLYSEKLLYP